ncbi:MAG: ribonuclease E, partial [Veillonella parvula]|nr:ribonuclease E [Veillonella parvula]
NPAAAVPTIETASVAKAPSETRVVRGGDKKSESVAKHDKEVKNTKKAAVDKAPKVKVVKDEKKADKEEPTKEEKKTLKVENHNLAQPISKKA